MYHLLVTAGEGIWNEPSYVLSLSRFLEHTDEALKARFGSLDNEAVAGLQQLPSLFAYESAVGEPARVGRIKTVQIRQDKIRITYEFDAAILPIDPARINDLVWELEIGDFEMTRTHWAVKDSDLLQVLRGAGLLADQQQREPIHTLSRQTVIHACNMLSTLGHTGFDRFLLELGVDDVNAGRDCGSLLARSNALAEFVLNHKHIRTAENEPIEFAVVRKAAHSDPHYPNGSLQNIQERERAAFWSGLERDGYAFRKGQLLVVSDPPVPVAASYAPPKRVLHQAIATAIPETVHVPLSSLPRTQRVFLVHGREHGALHQVARYLERLGLEVVILHERPNGGRTLISKFREESADICFAVVLMTPDDVGHLNGDGPPAPRARQNVVFELGFFIGKLGPERVCALVAGTLEKPSDFEAVVYIPFGSHTDWRNGLARELHAAGVAFDYSKVF